MVKAVDTPMTMPPEVPKTEPRSFRLTDVALRHLARLQRRLAGRSQSDVVDMALTHLLASLELQERIHLEVPSELEPKEDR